MQVLEGQRPDRVPVCLHNFSMAAEEFGIGMEAYLTDPEATANAHLEAQAKYGHDCIFLDIDTTLLAEAMGAKTDRTPGQPGHVAAPAIESLDEVGDLPDIDPQTAGRIPVLLEAVRILKRELGDAAAVRGNCDQMAFSLASLLRGMQDFMMDLITAPDDPRLEALLETCYRNHLAVHRAVLEAGADFTSVGDSPAGPDMISPDMFRKFARPWQERLVRTLAEDGVFCAIHICGDTSAILEDLAEFPRCGFELDYKTDAVRARDTVGQRHVLFGNIDPSGVVGRGTPQQVIEASHDLFDLWKPGGNFIFNAGCAIPAGTPPENIEAMMSVARDHGVYAPA